MSKSDFPVVTLSWFIVTVTWLEMKMVDDFPAEIDGRAKVLLVKATNEKVATLFGIQQTMEKFKTIDDVPFSDSGRMVFYQGTHVIEAIPPLQNLLNITGGLTQEEERDFISGTRGNKTKPEAKDTQRPTRTDSSDNVIYLRPKDPKK